MHTVAKRRDFKFREGRTTIVFPEGPTFVCNHAMYALSAHRSLISYQDLLGNGIHIFTALRTNEQVLELMEGSCCLASAYAEATSMYELPISNVTTDMIEASLYNGLKTS